MEKVTDVSKLVYSHVQGGQFRWITISTLLLAIGCILHLVSPSVGGVTPNWTIATYCVAINLTRPTYRQAFGIGLVAAMINVLTSKSGFPYGNLVSEPLGALTCAIMVRQLPNLRIGHYSLMPTLTGFVATCISGGAFVTLLKFALNLPNSVYFNAMLPLVVIIAALNAIVTPVLFFPALKLLKSRGFLSDSKDLAEVSDHSMYELTQQAEGVIAVEHLSYTYNRQEVPALDDVTLHVNKGDFLVITGASRCGKSTLCMAMTGAVPHYFGGVMTGMVFVNGRATTQVSIADLAYDIGTMLADYDSQLVTMTVAEEIAFSLENRGYGVGEIKRRMADALEKVNLSGFEKRSVNTLSGGQRQRLVIAGVLATEPSILVFDEPTSSLDPEGIAVFYELIGKLNRDYNHTVIIVEHTLDAAMPYANRLVLLEKGKIICDDVPAETLRYMYTHQVYASAVPQIYACQLAIEKAGYPMGTPWLAPEMAIEGVKSYIGGIDHVGIV